MAFLFITNIFAGDIYVYTGITQESDSGENMILINGQRYSINFNTVIHGAAVGGETGPIINAGQKIGFNIEQDDDELPHITEIWVLN